MNSITVIAERDCGTVICDLSLPREFDLDDPGDVFRDAVQRAFAEVDPEPGVEILLTLVLASGEEVTLAGTVREWKPPTQPH